MQSSHLTNPDADLILLFSHPPLLLTRVPFYLRGEERDAPTPTIFSNRLEYLYTDKGFGGKPRQNYYQSAARERNDEQRCKTGRDSGGGATMEACEQETEVEMGSEGNDEHTHRCHTIYALMAAYVRPV